MGRVKDSLGQIKTGGLASRVRDGNGPHPGSRRLCSFEPTRSVLGLNPFLPWVGFFRIQDENFVFGLPVRGFNTSLIHSNLANPLIFHSPRKPIGKISPPSLSHVHYYLRGLNEHDFFCQRLNNQRDLTSTGFE